MLKDKENNTYSKLFKYINKITNGGVYGRKIKIMGDLEIMKFNFLPEAEKKCCQFHLFQCIKRNATRIGNCSGGLKEDMMVLSIAPLDRVNWLFKYIFEKYSSSERYENWCENLMLLKYFFDNYIVGEIYVKESWNVSEEGNWTIIRLIGSEHGSEDV